MPLRWAFTITWQVEFVGPLLYNGAMNTERTQMARTGLSAPLRYILQNGYGPTKSQDVLHFGEGKALEDTIALRDNAPMTWAYDPHGLDEYVRDEQLLYSEYDWVYSGYVFNTLTEYDRVGAFHNMMNCVAPGGVAYIAVRTDKVDGIAHEDGVITTRETFQAQRDSIAWQHWFAMELDRGKYIVTVLTKQRSYCIIRVRHLEEL